MEPSLAHYFFDLSTAEGKALPVFILTSIEVFPHITTFSSAFLCLVSAPSAIYTSAISDLCPSFAGSLLGLNALTLVAAALLPDRCALDNTLPAFRGRRRFVFVMNRLATRCHDKKQERYVPSL
jgi:hypothetical protein